MITVSDFYAVAAGFCIALLIFLFQLIVLVLATKIISSEEQKLDDNNEQSNTKENGDTRKD